MKGCFVYFIDKETEAFFRSRTERVGDRPNRGDFVVRKAAASNHHKQTELL